jgi:hypothetical protein
VQVTDHSYGGIDHGGNLDFTLGPRLRHLRAGTASLKSDRSLALISGWTMERPVTLPPGRARLAATPAPTGSIAVAMMTETVLVACFAASARERLAVRQALSRPSVEDLRVYMRERLAKLSRGHDLAKAFNYILRRWASFTLFLEDDRVCLSNNAAEWGLRGIALGRKSWLFCGSDRGGQRAAAMYSLIITAKMNGVDPHACLADILARIAAHPAHRLDELLPWNWTPPTSEISAQAA